MIGEKSNIYKLGWLPWKKLLSRDYRRRLASGFNWAYSFTKNNKSRLLVEGLLECSNWKLLADCLTNSVHLHPFIVMNQKRAYTAALNNGANSMNVRDFGFQQFLEVPCYFACWLILSGISADSYLRGLLRLSIGWGSPVYMGYLEKLSQMNNEGG